MNAYLDKYIHNVKDHKSYLELIGGAEHLENLKQNEEYKEGYYL